MSTFLVAVYVIGGIVALILLLILVLYVVQRCCACRLRHESRHNAEMSEEASIEFYNVPKANNPRPVPPPSAPPLEPGAGEADGLMGGGAVGDTFTMRYRDEVKPPSYDEAVRQNSQFSNISDEPL